MPCSDFFSAGWVEPSSNAGSGKGPFAELDRDAPARWVDVLADEAEAFPLSTLGRADSALQLRFAAHAATTSALTPRPSEDDVIEIN